MLLHNLVYSKLFTTDRTIHRFLSAILLIVSSASAGALASQLLIDNVSVVDVTTGQVLSRRSVLIESGQIVSVTRSDDRQILRSGRIVDASGKYLIPGLWDMHVHTSSDRISREIILPLLIAHGVTGIRSMAADCFENHTPRCDESSPPYATIYQVEEWRLEISSQALIGPQIVASSFYTNGPDIHEKSTIYNPGTVQDATAYVELLYERGVDLIKIYDNVPRDAYFALAEAANRLDMPFAGHVPFSISASEAARAGQQSIEHVSGLIEECSSKEVTLKRRLEDDQGWSNYFDIMKEMISSFDKRKCSRLYSVFKEEEVWQVPTLMIFRFGSERGRHRIPWQEDARIRFVPREERRLWADSEVGYFGTKKGYPQRLQEYFKFPFTLIRGMRQAGVRILAGSDAGEFGIFWGSALHGELELLVDAGLTEAEALRAATSEVAQFIEQHDKFGTIEPGKTADLVLLDANPLESISNTRKIYGVILGGRLFARNELDQILTEVEAAAARIQ